MNSINQVCWLGTRSKVSVRRNASAVAAVTVADVAATLVELVPLDAVVADDEVVCLTTAAVETLFALVGMDRLFALAELGMVFTLMVLGVVFEVCMFFVLIVVGTTVFELGMIDMLFEKVEVFVDVDFFVDTSFVLMVATMAIVEVLFGELVVIPAFDVLVVFTVVALVLV